MLMVQRHLGRLQNWTEEYLRFIKETGKFLHLLCTEDPKGVLRDNKRTMSQHYAFMAKASNSILPCIRQSIANSSRMRVLLYSEDAGLDLECIVRFWVPRDRNITDFLE